MNDVPDPSRGPKDQIDYSSVETEEAVRAALPLVLEIREHGNGPLSRKVRLYERTLGVAVVPVLLRRLILNLLARRRIRRSTPR